MKLTPIILATALSASAQEIPMTKQLTDQYNRFITTNIALCHKKELTKEQCEEVVSKKVEEIVLKVQDVCKDFPTEVVPCSQY